MRVPLPQGRRNPIKTYGWITNLIFVPYYLAVFGMLIYIRGELFDVRHEWDQRLVLVIGMGAMLYVAVIVPVIVRFVIMGHDFNALHKANGRALLWALGLLGFMVLVGDSTTLDSVQITAWWGLAIWAVALLVWWIGVQFPGKIALDIRSSPPGTGLIGVSIDRGRDAHTVPHFVVYEHLQMSGPGTEGLKVRLRAIDDEDWRFVFWHTNWTEIVKDEVVNRPSNEIMVSLSQWNDDLIAEAHFVRHKANQQKLF